MPEDEDDINDQVLDQFEDEEEESEETPEQQAASAAEAASDEIDWYGTKVKKADLAPYVELAKWAQANPERYRELQEWSAGRARIAPIEQSQPEPEYDDEDDDIPPQLKARLSGLEAGVQTTAAALARTAAERGKENIQKRYNLKDNEAEDLLRYALSERLVAHSATKHPGDAFAAVDAALETAYKLTHFDKVAQNAQQAKKTETQRKQDWKKVGFGSTPAGRATQPPANEQEALERAIAEIREAQAQPS